MDFENAFAVHAPIDEVYEALLDLERVAPAMPGAKVLEKVDDDHFKVAIKVKLGPVSMTYRGDVSVVERDSGSHSAVLDVKAKEARGQGTATANVRMSLEPEGDATRGTMKAQVQLAGKAAAMGRGIIEDVSARLVQTFAQNLEGILGSGGGEPSGAAGGSGVAPGSASASASAPPSAAPGPEPEPDDTAIPVLPLVAGMIADRIRDPRVLGAVLAGAVAFGYALGRSRG